MTPIGPEVERRMREDWNRRAREDANYYVAFGRREQGEEEFFASAADVIRGLARELNRLPEGARSALEIGCGPGRLMRLLAPRCGEIHGVDVSDEMIRLARERLAGVSSAHVRRTAGASLEGFAADSFDFVYSYAVFQHIPSREVVLSYLREARRVLKPGGILRCQINGLPETAARYDTWSGVRIGAAEVAAFARDNDFQLLALEGAATQYMWTTWRKRPAGWTAGLAGHRPQGGVRIRRITNAHSSEPVAPSRGRFASIALWVEGLPEDCDLNHLEVLIGGRKGFGSYLGPAESDGLQQFNVALPEGLASGLQPLELAWLGAPLCAPRALRVTPPPPAVPRVVAVSDGIDLLSGTRIVSGIVKVTLEEAARPEEFGATVAGMPVRVIDIFCTDPLPPRHEINFRLPEGLPAGGHEIEMRLGRRRFAPCAIEAAPMAQRVL
ncbi:MAG: class I SAM-dependent methyltransferase [Acidobacteria bacterium]|nr:class I SAM-dependent methyltransferase [Acidobacteriota bacterium]